VTSLAITGGFTALTVTTVASELGRVTSLSDLVGTARLAPVPDTVGPRRVGIDVVVIGDSTAAGIGNSPLPRPTRADTACQRSSDAYAAAIRSISGRSTLNLACSSATISAGLLGPQRVGGVTLPAQVGALRAVESPSAVVVSVGANDVGWSDFLRYCYGLPRCDDEASDRLFLSRLDAFKVQYAQLLQQLSDLPGSPHVIVTTYYDPFGSSFDCDQLRDPSADAGRSPGYGLGPDPGQDNQGQKIDRKIQPLRSELRKMNAVLEQGAQAFGFTVAHPSFAGHELCTGQPWVQGMADPAPFHPRAAGGLAIAAAVLPHVPV
jgi:lysophospholipase L1-like esterase